MTKKLKKKQKKESGKNSSKDQQKKKNQSNTNIEKRLRNIERKLDLLIKEGKEELITTDNVEELEKKQIDELKSLENLEKRVEKDVNIHPLARITYRDFTKGTIGAFFGIIGHFAFLEGLHVAEKISMLRATALYIIAFFLGLLILYFSGFRKVKTKKIMKLQLYLLF